MKKGLFTLLLAVVATSVMAVDLPKQGFGFHIGYAQPTLRLNSNQTAYPKDSLINTTMLHGFKVGVVYDGSFVAGFGCSMGINYTFAGNKTDWTKTGLFDYPRHRSKTFYHEMELFVDWQYKFEVAKETYLMIYTGPTMQCGLALNKNVERQVVMNGDVVPDDPIHKYKTDDTNEAIKRLNVTWGVGAGFQYQRYFLRGGYDFGLINPYKAEQFDGIDRNTRGRFDQWSVKIGMYIWYDK